MTTRRPAERLAGGELRAASATVLCQSCGAPNPAEQDLCARCHQKLLVLSGPPSEEVEDLTRDRDADFSLDEHLLERVSILEEAVKRTAETVQRLVEALHKQEKNLLVSQTGFGTLRELLERRRLIGREEWADLWQAKMDYQLKALEKRERFVGVKDRIAALYHGDRRKPFLKHLEDAEYALFAFDVERARHCLGLAFKLDRDNYELALYLGETAFNEGEAEEALGYFARVLETRPDHFEALVFSGVICHERGESERAEKLLSQAVELYPDAFLPHFSLGAVYAAKGDLERAVEHLEDACQIDPVPQALYMLGNCFYEMGRSADAVDCLQEAVRLDPAFEEAHYLLGLAYLGRHWNRKALASFREAQRLNPRRLRYQDLVQYLSGRSVERLPEVGPQVAGLLARAQEHATRGEADRSVAAFQKAIDVEPSNPNVWMAYVMACLSLGRRQELEVAARRVLELDSSEMQRATAAAALIAALRGEGKFAEGNRIGRELLEGSKTSFTRTIAFYEMACNLAEMEEDLEQALDYARSALEVAPDELKQFPLAVLGWVHYKRREYEQAIECLERSAELGPSATTFTHLGMSLLAAGDEDAARAAFGRARSLEPRVGALEERMMECMKDSARLLERVKRRQKR
ncbi:MAG: tetratricopeptide repeat protein [Thermoanaerobaculia bacterium]|nr:MAG: tetratricopeptide repeat protein [Thermoanaerobaculia bacterium]MBZ0102921.1 tetratricopeptide repeat protein [Thermoanaerobaculia bacterium]